MLPTGASVKSDDQFDHVIVGAGFYGCSLALELKKRSQSVLLIESEGEILARASRVNQARVHTGFHYPRSIITAAKSALLHKRFAEEYSEAIVDDFQMLYAVARRQTKVSAKRFYYTFRSLGAPIEPATPSQRALFNEDTIDGVFSCTEWAFDYSILRSQLTARLKEAGVQVRLSTEATAVSEHGSGASVLLSSGEVILTSRVYNVTYSQTNKLLISAGLPLVKLKHEIAEIALIRPPRELLGYGITVMDGPFFSTMPYPSEGLYSLTHVRYTPHFSWTDEVVEKWPYDILKETVLTTRHRHMVLDASRYVPSMLHSDWKRSLFDVKTILIKNESDDGRPILYHRNDNSRITSVLGGKIDNVYDLFDLLTTEFDIESDILGDDCLK